MKNYTSKLTYPRLNYLASDGKCHRVLRPSGEKILRRYLPNESIYTEGDISDELERLMKTLSERDRNKLENELDNLSYDNNVEIRSTIIAEELKRINENKKNILQELEELLRNEELAMNQSFHDLILDFIEDTISHMLKKCKSLDDEYRKYVDEYNRINQY